MYIQVNVGRNFVPNKYNQFAGTLSDQEWQDYQDLVVSLLDN